jgi:hypothetical protein
MITRRFGPITADTITVNAAPATVWEVYTDVDKWSQWTASVSDAHVDPPGPLTIGSTASIKQPRFPRVVWTVTEVEHERWWSWANRAPGARTVAAHQLTPLDDGRTRVDLWIDQRGVLGRPIGWIARRTTRRYLRMEAEGLKRNTEARAITRTLAYTNDPTSLTVP